PEPPEIGTRHGGRDGSPRAGHCRPNWTDPHPSSGEYVVKYKLAYLLATSERTEARRLKFLFKKFGRIWPSLIARASPEGRITPGAAVRYCRSRPGPGSLQWGTPSRVRTTDPFRMAEEVKICDGGPRPSLIPFDP